MKNFKKVLALVLAVACVLSFAAVASAAHVIKTAEVYDDAASISAEYTEALDVLTAIGVLDGKGSSFKPKDTLKRSEAAKIIAVFANTDPEISSLYASANPFTDVAANHWAASYIAYAYKTGIIAGVKDGVFAPDARLTGIQFLKMVLCTLGYDAHEEGLVGNSWKVNTLQLAKNAGLTQVLGTGYNYDAELTREAAAQIMLNALNANTVSYGNAIKVASTMAAYETVAGAVANSEFMYQKWGLRKLNAQNDAFGRPGHKWLLNNTPFGNDPYTDAPLASYTVQVAGCQILSDCIFDTINPVGTKTLKVFENGVQLGTPATIADTTELKYGAQGRLTEVYEDRIVYIDTFLAKVLNVVPGRVDAQGHIIREAFVNAEVYVPTVNGYDKEMLTFETEGFVKDQFVRVTMSFAPVAAAQGDGLRIITMDPVETKQGIFNGYTGSFANGYTQVRLNEEFLNIANGFGYNVQGNMVNKWMGVELVAFMDQYGNVLGLDKYYAALNYGVVDALWLGVENGQAVLKADLVTMGGEVLSNVTVANITKNGVQYDANTFITEVPAAMQSANAITNTAAYAEAFKDHYDTLAYFTVNMNGQYELQLATNNEFDADTTAYYGKLRAFPAANEAENTTIEFTNGYAWAYKATTTAGVTTKTQFIPMDANTVVLVRTAGTETPFASRIAGGYTSYQGVSSIPAMTAGKVSWHINPTTGYADVIYVCDISVTGTKATVFAAGDAIQMTGITYDALNNKIYNYAVTVYVVDETTGALTKGTYTLTDKVLRADVAPAVGFHTAYISLNNEISFGINNANYNAPDANYMNATWTVLRDAAVQANMGPNGYEIVNGVNNVGITNISSTTHGYAFDAANAVSEISVVNSVQYDVLDGDTVYVYQNNNNPMNPIYSVVDVFENPVVKVTDGNFTYTEGDGQFEQVISSYSVGYKNRTWEAAYAAATANYQVVGMSNNGNMLTANAYGYYYDNTAFATVGEVVIYVQNIAVQNGGAKLVNVPYGFVQVRNAANYGEILVNGTSNVGNLIADLTTKLAADSTFATIKVYKNVIGTDPVEANELDPVAPGLTVVVTSFNGQAQTVYYVVNQFTIAAT